METVARTAVTNGNTLCAIADDYSQLRAAPSTSSLPDEEIDISKTLGF